MNYQQALEYIHAINWTFCKPGLERINALCEKLGVTVLDTDTKAALIEKIREATAE